MAKGSDMKKGQADEVMLGVGDGSGDLFVRGSHEAIKRVQAAICRHAESSREIERLQDANRELVERAKYHEAIKRDALDAKSRETNRANELAQENRDLRRRVEAQRADLFRAMGYIDRIVEGEPPVNGRRPGPAIGVELSGGSLSILSSELEHRS